MLGVLLTAAVKFLFAGALGYSLGFSFLTTFLLTALGGSLGMFGFFLAGAWVLELTKRNARRRAEERRRKGLPPKRMRTRTNRMVIRLRDSYGMAALMLLPPVLSVPVTAVLAAKYYRSDKRTLPLMLGAVWAWSLVLSVAWGFLQ